MNSARRREIIAALGFVSPWLIGFVVFTLYPLMASVYYSFCNYSVLNPPVWVGMTNYRNLLHDEVFWITLKNTALYALMAIPLGMLIAISLAMLLNAKVKGITFYRAIFFIPSLVPPVALSILWLWVFNSKFGLLNAGLKLAHIPGPEWLTSPLWAKPTIVLMGIWGAGNAVIIYLAGLQDVPQALYEAADLDGASWWARTRHVTLPMLSPVILFNGIMTIIGTLQVFTVPYIMFPGGSPARATYFYTMYLYDNAFQYFKMGYACAMGWIMFVLIVLLTTLSFRLSKRSVHYGSV